MSWLLQYDPPDGDNRLEGYDTEAEAELRANWLVNGRNYIRVVIFEIADGEEVA